MRLKSEYSIENMVAQINEDKEFGRFINNIAGKHVDFSIKSSNIKPFDIKMMVGKNQQNIKEREQK